MIEHLKNIRSLRKSGSFPQIRNKIESIFGFRPDGEIQHKDISTAYVGGFQEDEYYFSYEGLDFVFYVSSSCAHMTVNNQQCFDLDDLIKAMIQWKA